MRIIKLSAIDSTNTFLRQLSNAEALKDYTVVVAESQTNGRGQMGTVWHSEKSKNLMASVFLDVSFLAIEDSFYISMIISLAISKTLKGSQIKAIKVKWPNDILADQKKISGVLIENVIKNNRLQATIIGFGLNINQTHFENLPNATSMLKASGRLYDLDEILHVVITNLKHYAEMLKRGQFASIKELYEANLFRKNKPSTFEDAEGVLFSGFIKGVSNSGHLQVLVEDAVIKEFDLKEVRLLY
ncbi:biotin--[acetyl-CoA-carboxylase] ligase [Psychroserpens sp. SPM9]|uniref:biotin--[acetyl-CoA-carboxylase] ligase n=1 Tax=Psychroserpens sp. SPM9 TaxID=2975598 RepID=UPI0021A2DCC9|nr:biotin--[acetyl-CoA-carboxylase] ligase [Psychroserpens sp. SPM9]MDG5492431.1 biotin--[acetyl-CoA-carboxylase] ligase [Psychroserpens sp. SPM9]